MGFLLIVGDPDGPRRTLGPFSTPREAHRAGQTFTRMGITVEIRNEEIVCDFCSGTPVKWSFKAEDFYFPDTGWASRGDWAACDVCKELVEKRDQPALTKRSVDAYINKWGGQRQTIHYSITQLHEEFFRSYSGIPAVPELSPLEETSNG